MMAAVTPKRQRLADGTELTIRSPIPDDAQAMLAVTIGVMYETEFTFTSAEEFCFTDEQEREWIRSHTDEARSLLLVADVGEVVGLLNFSADRRRRLAHWGLVGMSIRDGWRDRGIGRALLSTLCEWAERHPDIRAVRLQVLATNERAIHLYRSLGFVLEGRRHGSVQAGPGRFVDDLLMARLTPGGGDDDGCDRSPDGGH